MVKLASILVACLWCLPAGAVELKIFTEGGFVAFTVEDAWTVVAMQTKPPVSVAAFQLPNAADEGTPESTNLAISLYHLDSEKAREALERVPKKEGQADPKVEQFKEWTVFRQEGRHSEITYSVLDATRKVADVAVGVRFAWPHLKRNPSNYDQRMEETFRSVLDSIYGHIGPYQPRDGEVIRRQSE